MKEKLTREVLEDMAKCRERYCPDCKGVCMDYAEKSGIETLAMALLEEMDKPKVWDGAPNDAVECHIVYRRRNDSGEDLKTFKTYTRELPKTRIDEIAGEACSSILMRSAPTNDFIEFTIKKAILKAKAEWEANR